MLTDASARLIGQQLFHAASLAGGWFNDGSQMGYVVATVALALERGEIGAEMHAIAKRLLAW